MRFLDGLRRALQKRGGRVVTNVHVLDIHDQSEGRVTLADGRAIEAASVIVATGSPINERFAVHTKQSAYMTYVVAMRVDPGAMPHLLLWDTGDPYHYVRVTAAPDEPGTELLLVGGEDHKTGQVHDQDARFARLEAWARERFAFVRETEFSWSGQVYETLDGLGYIGKDPGSRERIYVVTGDSGMGLTHGTIAATLLSDLVTGKQSALAELYDPSRKVPRAIGDYVLQNANVAAQYASWLTAGERDEIEQIPWNSGAVIRAGAHKLAVYRDDRGQVTACSATCPHLAAIVSWNDAEKTWDCPAHGSRFDCRGGVIQGPANSDLEAVNDEKPAATTAIVA